MGRELTGSEQARRAGLWDEVRPEALVPRERDPVTGSLARSADTDGGAKDRRTESSRSEAPAPSAPRHAPVVRPRWVLVAAAGAAALVVGVGGAVALVNRDADDAGRGAAPADPTPTGTAGPSPSSGSPGQTDAPVFAGPDERFYRGTLTSISDEGDVLSSGEQPVRVVCTDTCELFFIGNRREVTWPLEETDVTVVLPQEGDGSDLCGDGDFSQKETWVISVSEEDLDFTSTSTQIGPTTCPDGTTSTYPGGVVTFSGTLVPGR
ncbi:hypothetical protein [Oryzobacter terrae]|uniref:hypothetical protein n=1 Tax=Oryzobacter terrae TaxID=1620385 RepID=UPI00366C3362